MNKETIETGCKLLSSLFGTVAGVFTTYKLWGDFSSLIKNGR